MTDYEKRVTDMYIEDVNRLSKEIEELKKERDLWKNRCLESEADNVRRKRNMRHV